MHPTELGHEQRQLWARCEELWKLSITRETLPVHAALHPDYTGWVTGAERPHDREAAIACVGTSSLRVVAYKLTPLVVRVFEGRAGVIHYSYVAEVEAEKDMTQVVGGRWTEVYLRTESGEWVMIAVSGGPDGRRTTLHSVAQADAWIRRAASHLHHARRGNPQFARPGICAHLAYRFEHASGMRRRRSRMRSPEKAHHLSFGCFKARPGYHIFPAAPKDGCLSCSIPD